MAEPDLHLDQDAIAREVDRRFAFERFACGEEERPALPRRDPREVRRREDEQNDSRLTSSCANDLDQKVDVGIDPYDPRSSILDSELDAEATDGRQLTAALTRTCGGFAANAVVGPNVTIATTNAAAATILLVTTIIASPSPRRTRTPAEGSR